LRESGAGELVGGIEGGLAHDGEGDAFVVLGESFEQFDGAEEEAGGGAETASVDAVRGFAVMMLQVDEAAGELDEGFIVSVEGAVRAEPDVLQNVVGGVVFLRVEEPEVFEITRVPSAGGVAAGDLRGDLLVFAHGACGQQSTRRVAASAAKGRAGAGRPSG